MILVGHLGRDAETAYTASQTPVTKFSVATNRRWKDQASGEWKEETNWTNVVLWRQENLGQYLTKGKQVYVEGRLQTRSYDDKDGRKVWTTEVIADNVISGGDSPEGNDRRLGRGDQCSLSGESDRLCHGGHRASFDLRAIRRRSSIQKKGS